MARLQELRALDCRVKKLEVPLEMELLLGTTAFPHRGLQGRCRLILCFQRKIRPPQQLKGGRSIFGRTVGSTVGVMLQVIPSNPSKTRGLKYGSSLAKLLDPNGLLKRVR